MTESTTVTTPGRLSDFVPDSAESDTIADSSTDHAHTAVPSAQADEHSSSAPTTPPQSDPKSPTQSNDEQGDDSTPENPQSPTDAVLMNSTKLKLPERVPVTGWSKKRYDGFVARNPNQPVPENFRKLSPRDEAYWNREHLKMRREHHTGRIKNNMRDGVQPIIAVANTKSSTKTVTALHVAMNISYLSGKFVVVLPATMNTSTATLGRMAGIDDGRRLSIRELHERIEEFKDWRALAGALPMMDKFNTRIVSEDRRGQKTQGYTPWEFLHIVLTILPNVDVLVLDLANDNLDLENDSIGYFAARLAHALILPFKSGDPVSKNTLRDTVWELRDDVEPWEFNPHTAHLTPRDLRSLYENTGYTIPTPDKVALATVVANIFKPGDQPVDFKWLMRAEAARVPKWSGTGHHVPADPYISRIDIKDNGDELIPPCNLDLIQPETDAAFLEITADTLDVAKEIEGRAARNSSAFCHLWQRAEQQNLLDVVNDTLSLISPVSPNPSPKGGPK